jgi:hypothetical protein
MVALRSAHRQDDRADDTHESASSLPASDWLPLHQAACELGISVSTARRMIRAGKLRNRIVPRRGGFQYLIYVPNSRHASLLGHACGKRAEADSHAPVSLDVYRRMRYASATAADAPSGSLERDLRIRRLEEQVEHLSEALATVNAPQIRQPRVDVPPSAVGAPQDADDPYARYRWLVRRKRWWPF